MTGGPVLRRVGAYLTAAMLLLALFGPALAPYGPDDWAADPFLRPSAEHWLGTDDMGEDLFSALLHGARHSVFVALIVGIGATAAGALVGAGAGYRGGGWDAVAARLIDLQLALPTLPLVLVVAFYLGPSLMMLIGVLIIGLWAPAAREIRPQAAVLRQADFIVAERAMGAGEGEILIRYILPALAPLIWAQFTRLVHHAVLLESALAFLGLADPQWPSWGRTLYYANARAAFLGEAWPWWVLPPGLAIAVLVLGFSLLGIRDPRGVALGSTMGPRIPAPAGLPQRADLLKVADLHVSYSGSGQVLQGLDLRLGPGEVLGLAGLSGAGKSTLVQTLLGLLPPETQVKEGAVWLAGEELLRMPEKRRRRYRGEGMAWVPQAAMQSLNPVRRVGSQLLEVARLAGHRGKGADRIVSSALEGVGLSLDLLKAYPHALSGGMRQRVVIAMALCRRPRVLLADEPSSGLDREREEEILNLLVGLCRERQMALLLISHDLRLLAQHCGRLAILDSGRIVESGPTESILAAPRSSIGRLLAAAGPSQEGFAIRTLEKGPVVLAFEEVVFCYPKGAGLYNFSLQVGAGECVGLIGPSGAGKSTIAKLALGLLRPMQGEVRLLGKGLSTLHGNALRRHRRGAHLIFQDPFAALPFHHQVWEIVAEPLRLAGVRPEACFEAALVALTEAGLPHDDAERRVDSLSGGERQRVALARAWISRPRLIVADEPTSMLDAPAKWAWLERLDRLRRQHPLGVLLITHDLAQARAFCDRIVTLEEGRVTGIFTQETLPDEGSFRLPERRVSFGVSHPPSTRGFA